MREFSLTRGPLRLLAGQEVSFAAVVTTDPTWSRAKVRGAQTLPPAQSFIASANEVKSVDRVLHLRVPIRIMSKATLQLIPGERISGRAKVLISRERKVAALFILEQPPTIVAPANVIQRWSTHLRQRFAHRSQRIDGDSGTLIPGLVLGDTSRESESFVGAMRRVGLTHLTAVSGENFAIIAATLLWMSQWLIRRQRLRVILTALALVAFIFLVRPSPSVLRASVMTGVLLLAKVKGSRADPLASLGFAVGILVLLDPFQALDAGFALSVAATAGILLLAPRISNYLHERGVSERVAEFVAIPISATALCSPIIVAISGQLSLIAIPINLIVSLVVAPITILGFIAALVPWSSLAHLLLVLVNPFAHWITWIAREGANFPLLTLPRNLAGIAIVLVGVVLVLRKKWIFLTAEILLVLLIFLAQSIAWPGSNWRVANCDVGQGDALAINLGHGQAIVIDVGPDPLLINTCVRDLGITTVPLLVLTHFHADHVGGLPGLMRAATVKSVWISDSTQPATEYSAVMNELSAVATSIAHEGQAVHFASEFGEVAIRVIWPQENFNQSTLSFTDGSTINNSSVALLISIGALSLFASGDVEPPAQSEIVAGEALPHVQILKVPHHGSAYQDARLYQELHPEIALISVGAGNSYGHPAQKTLLGLRQAGAHVFRTDLDGAISIDASLRIRTNKKAWWKISWG